MYSAIRKRRTPNATWARGAALNHRAWGIANEARNKLRYAWRDPFQRFGVLLTPVAATERSLPRLSPRNLLYHAESA
jgi:hypothetical protein